MTKVNYYVLFTDESTGKVEFVCNCDQCRKRGQVEVSIRKENGINEYYTLNELFDEDLISRVSKDFEDLFLKTYTREETLINVCRILQNALLKRG